MYYIRKYKDCWAIHNDDNGNSRKLTDQEVARAKAEFPALKDPQVLTFYTDQVRSIKEKP